MLSDVRASARDPEILLSDPGGQVLRKVPNQLLDRGRRGFIDVASANRQHRRGGRGGADMGARHDDILIAPGRGTFARPAIHRNAADHQRRADRMISKAGPFEQLGECLLSREAA